VSFSKRGACRTHDGRFDVVTTPQTLQGGTETTQVKPYSVTVSRTDPRIYMRK
jgi:hypothetical protein